MCGVDDFQNYCHHGFLGGYYRYKELESGNQMLKEARISSIFRKERVQKKEQVNVLESCD